MSGNKYFIICHEYTLIVYSIIRTKEIFSNKMALRKMPDKSKSTLYVQETVPDKMHANRATGCSNF